MSNKSRTRREFLKTAGIGLGSATLGTDRSQSGAVEGNAGPKAGAEADTPPRRNDCSGTRYVNDRTDRELVATWGTCYQNDFRFFTMLRQESWDLLRWETLGNAVQAHRGWNHWPYEQRLRITINGADVASTAQVDEIEQQFDFRRVKISSPFGTLERLDLMISARQWLTALRVANTLSIPADVALEIEWVVRDSGALIARAHPNASAAGFVFSRAGGPPMLVSASEDMTWEKRGADAASTRWKTSLQPGESSTVNLDVHVGWAAPVGYEDEGPGRPATDLQAAADRISDRVGFAAVSSALGVEVDTRRWQDLDNLCHVRRNYLYLRMPSLQGFSREWSGMWSYVFDLMRSGIYPAQANFNDVWMVADLVVYREPFSWDGPASVHSFCHWDADLAARSLRTYLRGATRRDGTLSVSSNPYRAFPNLIPQLTNNTMALWDCYQMTNDLSLLADCYPLLVRHVRWLETKRNRTPRGPLLDIGSNIDYGPTELYKSPTIWVDVQCFLVDHYRTLGRIAKVIGRPGSEQQEWMQKAERLAAAVREHMWDDDAGTFWCVSDTLQFKRVGSPVEFHSMTTGVASSEQARRLLLRLKDPAKYAPSPRYPFGLPSAPFDSPWFIVQDGWSGTVWPIQTYYTVRGLASYGFQDEAATLARTLYWMMARDYRVTGTIWEQYDPRTGRDLDATPGSGRDSAADIGRGHFISGIATSVLDALVRGILGFERTDDPSKFYLTPRPLMGNWHGIDDLTLSGATRLTIRIRGEDQATGCKIKITGAKVAPRSISIHRVDIGAGTSTLIDELALDDRQEVALVLKHIPGCRYAWKLQ